MDKLEKDMVTVLSQKNIKFNESTYPSELERAKLIEIREEDAFLTEDNSIISLKSKNLIKFLILLFILNLSLAIILFLK